MRRVALAAAMLLLAACTFGAPGGGDPSDPGGGGGGGNGSPDAPCADDDGDTVCNAADRCAGHDDRLDVDADGMADGCDDWPCGAKPDDPGEAMSDSGSGSREWEAWPINIGDARRAVAAPGQQLSVKFGWRFRLDCPSGSSCRAQLELGYDATRVRCVYDGDVSDDQWRLGYHDSQLAAPTTPGVYQIRLNAGQSPSCGAGATWYGGDPGPDSTIAFLCVR